MIRRELHKKMKFDQMNIRYMFNDESVLENEMHKFSRILSYKMIP